MTSSLRSLWRRWEHFTSAPRTVLAITKDARCQMSLRVFSIEEGWRILFAESIEAARRLQALSGICVLVYDGDLPGVDWRNGLRALVTSKAPMLPIVMASAPTSRLRAEVLNCGGYDVARNPLDPSSFVCLVNGALALADSIESLK